MKRCQNRSQDPGLVAVPASCFLPHSIASAVERFTAVRHARSHSCGAHSFLTGKLMFPVNRIETEVKNIFHGNILLSSRLWKNASSEAMLLLLSRFSRATPSTATHQAPPSLGFSRQEHWSGLPFPSPMHESEK